MSLVFRMGHFFYHFLTSKSIPLYCGPMSIYRMAKKIWHNYFCTP